MLSVHTRLRQFLLGLLGDGVISSSTDKTAVVTYAAPGKKNVTLKLKNGWGEAEKTVEEIVEITSEANAIDAVDAQLGFSVYPSPFVESVNLRFADNGRYTVNVLGTTGALLQSNSFEAAQGQVVNVAITGTRVCTLFRCLRMVRLQDREGCEEVTGNHNLTDRPLPLAPPP